MLAFRWSFLSYEVRKTPRVLWSCYKLSGRRHLGGHGYRKLRQAEAERTGLWVDQGYVENRRNRKLSDPFGPLRTPSDPFGPLRTPSDPFPFWKDVLGVASGANLGWWLPSVGGVARRFPTPAFPLDLAKISIISQPYYPYSSLWHMPHCFVK